MKAINFKQFSVDDLLTLRDQISAQLVSRVDRERRDLESRLKRLQRFKSASDEPRKGKLAASAQKVAKKKRKKSAKRVATKKVAPKYRNPENPAETWTGRGLKPRWMTAEIKAGKSVEEFRIAS